MSVRPLTVIAVMLAASPATAQDNAIRLFAPVPNGPASVKQAPAPQPDAIRLFSPVPSSPEAGAPQPRAPTIRGTVRETVTAQALPADRAWIIAPR